MLSSSSSYSLFNRGLYLVGLFLLFGGSQLLFVTSFQVLLVTNNSKYVVGRTTTTKIEAHGNVNENYNDNEISPLLLLDPNSEDAKQICYEQLHLTQEQYEKVAIQYTNCIIDWNEKINLVSRKECTSWTVFTKHILPCLCTKTIPKLQHLFEGDNIRIMDVGTGGGFPGIPLSIQYPHCQFVLSDSVGKKINAVQDMIDELNLNNNDNKNRVRTYNGRVEDYFIITNDQEKFDIVTGRSVTAISQFCAWVQHVLKPNGHVIYWIGGEIDNDILQYVTENVAIQDCISTCWNDNYDKRILVIPASNVQQIAKESGIIVKPKNINTNNNNNKKKKKSKKSSNKKSNIAKGAWKKRKDETQPKQRGYETFQRYSSSSQRGQ